MPHYNNRQISGNLSGPFGKKISWFLDLSERNFNTAQLINAETLEPAPTFALTSFNSTFATPSKSYSVNPRVDYAINANNTLVLRYMRTSGSNENGVGGFNLPSQVNYGVNKFTTVQATETMVIGHEIRATKSCSSSTIRARTPRPPAWADRPSTLPALSPAAATLRRIITATAAMSSRKTTPLRRASTL